MAKILIITICFIIIFYKKLEKKDLCSLDISILVLLPLSHYFLFLVELMMVLRFLLTD